MSTHPQEAETDALDGRDAAVLTRGRVAPPGPAPVVLHGIPALSRDPFDRCILQKKEKNQPVLWEEEGGRGSETNSGLGCFGHGHRRVFRHLEQDSKR